MGKIQPVTKGGGKGHTCNYVNIKYFKWKNKHLLPIKHINTTLLEEGHIHLFKYYMWLLSWGNSRDEYLQQRPYEPQSLKCFLLALYGNVCRYGFYPTLLTSLIPNKTLNFPLDASKWQLQQYHNQKYLHPKFSSIINTQSWLVVNLTMEENDRLQNPWKLGVVGWERSGRLSYISCYEF